MRQPSRNGLEIRMIIRLRERRDIVQESIALPRSIENPWKGNLKGREDERGDQRCVIMVTCLPGDAVS